jgi:hypothetical protein
MSSLDDQLALMARREMAAQRRTPNYRQFFPAKMEAPKSVNGVRLNSNNTVTIHGTTYTRDQFRIKLRELVSGMQGDSKSAYRDRKHPNHQQAVEEVALAYKFLAGEISPQDEHAIVSEWNEATQESEVSELQPHQEIAQILSTPEGRTALQRARTGQPLDARQKEIVARHDALEAQNNAVARKEQAGVGGVMKISRPPTIPSELFALERITDPKERLMGIRELQAKWRDDKASAYSDVKNPNHKSAVDGMRRLYEEAERLELQEGDSDE